MRLIYKRRSISFALFVPSVDKSFSDCPGQVNPVNITPLAAESLGVRSSAVFVETADVKILIDPGVSLAPMRFGLRPHPLEIRKMNESWLRIKEHASRADILIITHYHFDHFDPTEPLVFNNKVLLLKHPEDRINASQVQRARELMKGYRTLPRRVEFSDNARFSFGRTSIQFSPAQPHGPNPKVGWVVQTSIQDDDARFLYTSDIQGACLPEQAGFILAGDPDVLYLDGPLTYLMGQGFTPDDLRASTNNIGKVLEATRVKTIIMDHHGLRDGNWKAERRELAARAAELGKKIVTAAEFLGKENELLEAQRKELFIRYAGMPGEKIMRSRNFQLCKELAKKQVS